MYLLDEDVAFFSFLTGMFRLGVMTGDNVITKLNNFPTTLSPVGSL